MSSSIIITTPILLFFSVVAFILSMAVIFVRNEKAITALVTLSFIIVIADIIYALLLGSKLREILIYVLIFLLIYSTTVAYSIRQFKREEIAAEKDQDKDEGINPKNIDDRGEGA